MINVEMFRQLAEHLPYGLYIVSPDRTILFWNDEAERITGYTREEMIGRKCPSTHLNHLDEKGTPLCETYYFKFLKRTAPRRCQLEGYGDV